jgi:hypothetical protein
LDIQQSPKIGKVLGGIKGKITSLKTFDANEEEGTNTFKWMATTMWI